MHVAVYGRALDSFSPIMALCEPEPSCLPERRETRASRRHWRTGNMDSIAESFPDLTPIEQDDGPVPVVQIAYSQAFTIVMGYFRRVLVNEEYSERALLLSAEVIDHNAANYTAWQYRRRCVAEMHKNDPEEERLAAWREELKYCSEQCMNNAKNYQVWFHRRACIAALGDATGELDFIAAVLDDDAKNYHAWGHRQWVLKTFNLWATELAYVDELLSADVRNNSAWNQRYFVLQASADLNSPDLVASEIACALAPAITHAALRALAPPRAVLSAGLVSLIVCVRADTLKQIARAPSNPSPWAYVKGLVEPLGYSSFPQLRQTCERISAPPPAPSSAPAGVDGAAPAVDGAAPAEASVPAGSHALGGPPRCVPAISLLVDILVASAEGAELTRAAALCAELVKLDPIRERYWRWRQSRTAAAA